MKCAFCVQDGKISGNHGDAVTQVEGTALCADHAGGALTYTRIGNQRRIRERREPKRG